MQLTSEFIQSPRSYQPAALQEMYESTELFNEGLASFEYPLYFATDEELDYFLGSAISSVSKAVGNIAKPVTKTVGSVAKTVGKAISTVDKVVPMSVLTSGLSYTPMGLAARAGLGALQAAGEGKNTFQGAVRSLANDPVTRFYVDTGMAAARGENVLRAIQKSAQAQIGDLRKSLQFAAMVAPFVPGLGTGVAAALGAANALAAGEPITDALIAAARSAIPGGAVAQVAFDTAMNLAKGKSIGESLLNSARAQLPGGPATQAAFDAAVALAKGRNIQDAAFAAAGRLLPPSPYAENALSFVKKIASGQNIQKAALSTVGNMVLNKIEQQAGPIVSQLRAQVPQATSRLATGPIWQTALKAAEAATHGGKPAIASRLSDRIPQPAPPFSLFPSRAQNLPPRISGPATQAEVGPPTRVAPRSAAAFPTRSGTWERIGDHMIVLDT
jgi:hypothetical protein